MNPCILIGFLITVGSIVELTSAACKQPSIPAGSTWISSPNCPSGPTYEQTNPSRKHCHCWGHCGYICDPIKGGATPTTAPAANCPQTCLNGPIWIPPNNPNLRCRCQGFNKCKYYLCEETTTAATNGTTPTTGSPSTNGTTSTNATTPATAAS